jgi:hypothetical protein
MSVHDAIAAGRILRGHFDLVLHDLVEDLPHAQLAYIFVFWRSTCLRLKIMFEKC